MKDSINILYHNSFVLNIQKRGRKPVQYIAHCGGHEKDTFSNIIYRKFYLFILPIF